MYFLLFFIGFFIGLFLYKISINNLTNTIINKKLEKFVFSFILSIIYVFIYNKYNLSLLFLLNIVLFNTLFICSISDIKEFIVPDKFIYVPYIICFIIRLIKNNNFTYFLISSIVIFFLLYLVYCFSHNSLGGADVKIYAFIGFIIGLEYSILSLFYCCFCALIINIFNLFKKKYQIPLIPYITFGVFLTNMIVL